MLPIRVGPQPIHHKVPLWLLSVPQLERSISELSGKPTCQPVAQTYAASLCSSAFKYQMQIQCLYVFGSPGAPWQKFHRWLEFLQRFDPKTWFMWQTRLSPVCICNFFFFFWLCMCLPLLCMHKPLLGMFLEKSLHGCIIVDVQVRAFSTDVSFRGVCFLYSS